MTLQESFRILKGKPLTPQAKLFYLWLCSVLQPGNSLQLSQHRLHLESGIPKMYLPKIKDELEAIGLIRIIKGKYSIGITDSIILVNNPEIKLIIEDRTSKDKVFRSKHYTKQLSKRL